MISSSLKPNYQVLEFPPRWLPRPVRWQNYPEALTYVPFGRYALNTLFVSVMNIVGNVVSCTLVAYGFARLRAPGKNVLFLLLLATMMLPYPATMIPIYIGFNALGWVNTFWPLIVPAFFGNAFYIFLLRQFFLTIPEDLEAAARIDGANTWQIIWHVILPVVRPAIATVAIFTFQSTWNDFLAPLIYLHDQTKYTVSPATPRRASAPIREGIELVGFAVPTGIEARHVPFEHGPRQANGVVTALDRSGSRGYLVFSSILIPRDGVSDVSHYALPARQPPLVPYQGRCPRP
jgi:ABC-type glycerol-3-phosphate transport system permease component